MRGAGTPEPTRARPDNAKPRTKQVSCRQDDRVLEHARCTLGLLYVVCSQLSDIATLSALVAAIPRLSTAADALPVTFRMPANAIID